MRAVSVLEVADPSVWAELAAVEDLEPHLAETLSPTRRVVRPSFEREVLPRLGAQVLVRYARRDPAEVVATQDDLAQRVAGLGSTARRVLHACQRHAMDDVVVGLQAWDPLHDAPIVRELVSAGLLQPLPGQAPPYGGRYHLHPDLPPPPEVPYDFDEAIMDPTDDLGPALPGAIALLHDMAALAAVVHRVPARRTYAGTLSRPDTRRLGRRLGCRSLASSGDLESDPRWSRALRALELLGVVSLDPLSRQLRLDLGLERTLAGEAPDAVDRLVHRILDRDLHAVLPAIRAALRQAGDRAIDELVFLELVCTQHREVLFPSWSREGERIYPVLEGETARPYDEEGFERIEAPLIRRVLHRAEHVGLIRRAPGVFASTADGRRWAGAPALPDAPVWVSSDLEVMVPPDSITPWERFQLERLGRCLGRDVVDRYRLERSGLVAWLSTHDLDEALDLLRRRCPALPVTVVDTLTEWTRSAMRVVLTRGVLIEGD